MTGKEPDSLTYKKYKYDIINSKDEELFDPVIMGLNLYPILQLAGEDS